MLEYIFLKMIFPLMYSSQTLFSGLTISFYLYFVYFVFYYGMDKINVALFKRMHEFYTIYKLITLSVIISLLNFLTYNFLRADELLTGLSLCLLLPMSKDKKYIAYLGMSVVSIVLFSIIFELLSTGAVTVLILKDKEIKFNLSPYYISQFNTPFVKYMTFGIFSLFAFKFLNAKS